MGIMGPAIIIASLLVNLVCIKDCIFCFIQIANLEFIMSQDILGNNTSIFLICLSDSSLMAQTDMSVCQDGNYFGLAKTFKFHFIFYTALRL